MVKIKVELGGSPFFAGKLSADPGVLKVLQTMVCFAAGDVPDIVSAVALELVKFLVGVNGEGVGPDPERDEKKKRNNEGEKDFFHIKTTNFRLSCGIGERQGGFGKLPLDNKGEGSLD